MFPLYRFASEVRILILTNLYPPHHAGTYDFRCESVARALRQRRHEVRVLTSNHGLKTEQRGTDTERRLRLNGVYGHPQITRLLDLKDLEFHNHTVVNETILEFQPELLYVWSLHGLSKSLVFTFDRHPVPVVCDVADNWLADELRSDPWLAFWNREKLSFADRALRTSLELSAQRDKWDQVAPTRPATDVKRLPFLSDPAVDSVEPNSVTWLRFHGLSFCSVALRQRALKAGYCVDNSLVIHPCVDIGNFRAPVKPAAVPARRLLVFGPLKHGSGVLTALRAYLELHKSDAQVALTIAGRGDSDYVAKLKSFVVQNELPVEFEMISDPTKEMPAVFAKHDILLHTVETDDDFSVAPLEGMVAGLPAVVTRFGTAGEFFRHGENSITYAPGDGNDLAGRIYELQSRPDLREYIATTGQNEVVAQFNEKTVMDRTEQYLTAVRNAAT